MEDENLQKLAQDAYDHISSKDVTKQLVHSFANLSFHPPVEQPVSVFMAGCPGAGKTEYAEKLTKNLGKDVVNIDPDAIRLFCPGYDGSNSYIFQRAISFGVSQIFYHAIKHSQNLIMDGTFKSYKNNYENIKISLSKSRIVVIYYIFQTPEIAWDFTKKREALENRRVTKEAFIEAFLLSIENVQKVKKEFGNKVELNLVIKDKINALKRLELNVETIDSYIEKHYSKEELERLII